MKRTSRKSSLQLDFELDLMKSGYQCIAGIDEVGRGPLAGPVVAAAVILDPGNVPEGLGDSKTIPARRRAELYEQIIASSRVSTAAIPHDDIDRINIRQATLLAMRSSFSGLPCCPDMALVDGNDPPQLPCDVRSIVAGDATIASIAAASIIAKVTRDRIMAKIALQFPVYGFERNAGYGTAEHLAALAQHGPCPHHRMSFAPLRQGRFKFQN